MSRLVEHAARWVRAGRARVADALFGSIVDVTVDGPLVALTFDDGPHPVTTPQVLEVLERHQARATFFMVGAAAARHPDLVTRVVAGGHAVGHHGRDHLSLAGADREVRLQQIAGGFEDVGPACARLFRPPYGYLDLPCWWTAHRLGHEVVAWSAHAWDWVGQDADTLLRRLRAALRPGAIVLLHDAPQPCDGDSQRQALLTGLDQLLAEAASDWRFVTLPQLLAAGRPRRRYWRLPRTPPSDVHGDRASDAGAGTRS